MDFLKNFEQSIMYQHRKFNRPLGNFGLGGITLEHTVHSRVGKIPENPSPVPAPFFEVFWGFSPKNPQRLSLPRPQSIPKPFRGSIPVPIPVFWGFSGIEPQKNSKSNPSPSPKNPQNFSKPCPRPRSVPKIWGWGQGNLGIPPYYSQI